MEEGKSLLVDLSAKANPPAIDYKWTDPDRGNIPSVADSLPESRLIADGGRLNVTGARRGDRGKYKVRATNEEGKTTVKFRIDVQYAPR